jgi:hypothetical protein
LDEIIAIVKHFKDEPLALVVLGGIVGVRAVELLIKYVPRFFTKKKEKTETKTWQDFVSGKINEIESKIEKLFSAVSVHEQFSNKISEGTLTNQLFSDGLWPFLRLKAFRRLLAMGKNGRIKDKGFTLVLKHKEDWLNVLDTELGMEIADPEYYNARLGEIRKIIFDDFAKA